MPALSSVSNGPTCEGAAGLFIPHTCTHAPPDGLSSLPRCSFMFDEPSSYLDVKQRLKAAITIRSLITPDR